MGAAGLYQSLHSLLNLSRPPVSACNLDLIIVLPHRLLSCGPHSMRPPLPPLLQSLSPPHPPVPSLLYTCQSQANTQLYAQQTCCSSCLHCWVKYFKWLALSAEAQPSLSVPSCCSFSSEHLPDIIYLFLPALFFPPSLRDMSARGQSFSNLTSCFNSLYPPAPVSE